MHKVLGAGLEGVDTSITWHIHCSGISLQMSATFNLHRERFLNRDAVNDREMQ